MAIHNVGFVGLGAMGRPMAANLLKAGFQVTVYNRTAERARDLVAQGAQVAASPAALAETMDAVITMVADDAALDAVTLGDAGILTGSRPGLIHIDMSTVSPHTSRRLAGLEAEKGVAFVDAPVSGSVKPATDGTLTIMAGGDAATYEAVRPLLAAMGNRVFRLGPAGAGHTMKLAVNLILGTEIQILSEALVFGEAQGLDRRAMLEVIAGSSVGSPVMGLKVEGLSKHEYPPAFALKHATKDLRLAVTAAAAGAIPLPTGSVVQALYAAAIAQGYGDEDVIAIDRVMRGLMNK